MARSQIIEKQNIKEMALIKCPNCGGTISDKAVKCVHCGAELNKVETTSDEITTSEVETASKEETISKDQPCSSAGEVVQKNKRDSSLIILLYVFLGFVALIIVFFVINQLGTSADKSSPEISTLSEKNNENGHEYVDLGLPSGTLWATMNVGATSPEEYGDYYAWGETETKSDYSWSTYMGGMNDNRDCGTSNDPLKDYVNPNQKSIAGTEYDVAHVKWGGKWKMPTLDQMKELCNSSYCTTTWTSNYNGTGVAGCIITSKMAGYEGNSIFLPAAGYRFGSSLNAEGTYGRYWSATPRSDRALEAYNLIFYSNDIYGDDDNRRFVGLPVRPVLEKSTTDRPADKVVPKDDKLINGHEYVELGLPSGTKWATMNVGATSPEEYGGYYAWGETETKSEYEWENYMGMSSGEDCNTSNDPLKDYVYPNQKSIAGTKYDVAHAKWGGTWKMPTEEQIEELYNSDYCTIKWTDNYNGTDVAGRIITSKVMGYEGNSIFLPAAGYRSGSSLSDEGSYGYYWSATPYGNYADYACSLNFHSDDVNWYGNFRFVGLPVRPVSE